MSAGWLLVVIGLAAVGFALAFGGRDERIFATAQAVSTLAEHSFIRTGSIASAVLVDLAVLAVVVPLALRSPKVWPLMAASLCVATLMTEGAQMLVHASETAYSIIQGAWDLLANLIVALAAWSVWRERRGRDAQEETPGPG